MTSPQYPAGEYIPEPNPSPARRAELIAEIEQLPAKLAAVVKSLPSGVIDLPYRKWTARQIVNHLADSHTNAYVRFRLTLTEEKPTIKPYDESKWAELPDAKTADVQWSLDMLTALHARWVMLLNAMTDDDFRREYFHPEYKKTFSLNEVLGLYAHHGRHHLGQIEWMKANQ